MQITTREREICDLLRKEPMISQEELASRLGITRSSVAVHISNLIKKGIIVGKGYVFSQQTTCAVIGHAAYITDVDPGHTIIREPEGLAIKGCQALQSLDLSVKVFTILGTDREGDDLLALLSSGADVNGVMRQAQQPTRQRIRIKYNDHEETYSNLHDNTKLIDYLSSFPHRWLDCNYLWMEPEFVPQLAPIISEYAGQLPTTVVCSSDESTDDHYNVDLLIKGISNGYTKNIPNSDQTLVLTDGLHYVQARSKQEQVEVDILPGQQFDIKTQLERFTAGFIYGISCGIQLRQAVRLAIGNTVYQV